MGVGGLTPRPGRFTPWKETYELYRRLGGPQGGSGPVQKISPPNGIRSADRLAHKLWCPDVLYMHMGLVRRTGRLPFKYLLVIPPVHNHSLQFALLWTASKMGDCDDTFFRDVALCNYYRAAKFFAANKFRGILLNPKFHYHHISQLNSIRALLI